MKGQWACRSNIKCETCLPISPGIPSSAAAKGIQQDSRLYRPDDDDDLEEEEEGNEEREKQEVFGSTDQHLIAANAEWVQREKVFRGVSEEMFVWKYWNWSNGCVIAKPHLNSWRNLSALGSPRLWAMAAFTVKGTNHKGLKSCQMYQHRPQYCRAGIQDETLDHGGLAARKTWTEKDQKSKPKKIRATCSEQDQVLWHSQGCAPGQAAWCRRTRACRRCRLCRRTTHRRTCQASPGSPRSSWSTPPAPWCDILHLLSSFTMASITIELAHVFILDHGISTWVLFPRVLFSHPSLDPLPGQRRGSRMKPFFVGTCSNSVTNVLKAIYLLHQVL